MKFFLPLLGIVILLFFVGRYFLRQLTHEREPRYGDGSRIIPGSIQSSQPPPKAPPFITAAEHAARVRGDDIPKVEEEAPRIITPQSKAQQIKGNKADLKRAFMLRWLLDRYDK